jgi:branched-chain amino acid transport system ATP-binding protein
MSMRISHRLFVMGHGHVVFEGTPESLAKNQAVTKEWLEV